MGHLSDGMYTCVGTSSSAQPYRRAENTCQRLIQHASDCALSRLDRPSCEIGSVVGDVESKTDILTNSQRPCQTRLRIPPRPT